MQDESGTNILLDLLPVAEAPVNGKRDDRTLKAIIKALGRLRIENTEVLNALGRLKADFPAEVDKSLTQIQQGDGS